VDLQVALALVAACFASGCGEPAPEPVPKPVYFVASEYCVSWALDVSRPPSGGDADAGIDAGLPGVTALSADLAALDTSMLAQGRYEPVAAPPCRSVPSAGGVTSAGTVLAAAGLVGEVPTLPDRHRYRLIGGFYVNDDACGADAFLVCAISREFGSEDEPLSLYLLCPPIDATCRTNRDCLPGAVCVGSCQDTAPDDLLGGLPITYDVCKGLHAEVVASSP
jgi:hypothetical protein